MKNRVFRFSVAMFVVFLAASASRAQQEPKYKELPNFHKVSDTLYRGAQPLGGGIKKLAELGVKTVVNLRGEADLVSLEKKEVEASGLRYFSIPMPGLSAPSDDEVARVIALLDNPENQPVFIHCKRGSDRTGTISAIFRISHESWPAERAIAEARLYGMSWAEFGMRGYILDYSKRKGRSQNQTTTTAAANR